MTLRDAGRVVQSAFLYLLGFGLVLGIFAAVGQFRTFFAESAPDLAGGFSAIIPVLAVVVVIWMMSELLEGLALTLLALAQGWRGAAWRQRITVTLFVGVLYLGFTHVPWTTSFALVVIGSIASAVEDWKSHKKHDWLEARAVAEELAEES
jgi:hypothetical protein